MRRRNSRGNNSDSLDLLLDTICNTFGGIVFISLLVVILANVTNKEVSNEPPDPETQSKLISLQRELDTTQNKMQQMQAAVKQQQDFEEEFTSKESIRLARELHIERTRITRSVGNNNSLIAKIGQFQTQTNKIAQQLKDQRNSIITTAKQLNVAEQRLASEKRKRTRDITLPTVSQWDGSVANTILKDGSLCLLQTAVNGFLSFNTSESKIITENGQKIVVPIIPNGLKINLKSPNRAEIQEKMRVYDPKKHLVRVWVTPNSFEEFSLVRESLVKMKLRYEIIPFPQAGRLVLGSSRKQTRAQ